MATRTKMADAAAQLKLPVTEPDGARNQATQSVRPRRRLSPAFAPPAPTAAAPVQPDFVADAAVAAGPPVPAPVSPAPIIDMADIIEEAPRTAFGQWLLRQVGHKQDWIANLAKAAKVDPRFPKSGSVDEVRKHLSGLGAEGDMFEALDDAETAWLRS